MNLRGKTFPAHPRVSIPGGDGEFEAEEVLDGDGDAGGVSLDATEDAGISALEFLLLASLHYGLAMLGAFLVLEVQLVAH